MADTAAFDTLATARKLKAAGIAEAHAEAIAEAQAEAARAGRSELATKVDLEAAIAGLEARLAWRLVTGAVIIVGALFGLFQAFPPQ